MDIYIEGLEVYGRHGVAPEEKVLGQRFLFDIRLTTAACPAALSDDVAEAVDYTQVIDLVVEVATSEAYALLERLARVAAEAVLRRFAVDEVWLKVTKPHPPIARSLTGVGVAVTLQRADIEG